MTLADLILAVIFLGISAYAVFGGADFGAGIWDLLAGGPDRGRAARALIERAIGPVWEANHVWLIFVLVYLWTAFPVPFVAIATSLWIPLLLAALGIVFRGSGFAFRKWATTVGRQRYYGIWFAGASTATPFFLGTVVGAVASGRVPLGNAVADPFRSWLNPTSLLGGTMAVVSCAYVAAVLLVREAVQDGDAGLTSYFRRRALVTGVMAGVLALAGIGILRGDAGVLYDGLIGPPGVWLVALSAGAGLGSLLALATRRFLLARPLAALATVTVLWGWGAAQYPWLLEGEALVADHAASPPVLVALLAAFAAAVLLVVPALVFLLRLTETRFLSEGAARSDSTAALMAENPPSGAYNPRQGSRTPRQNGRG